MAIAESNLPIIYKGPEMPALPEVSHAALLTEVYDNLTHEMERNGNSSRLLELRKLYFERFLSYWQNQISLYRKVFEQDGSKGRFAGKKIHIGGNEVSITESVHLHRQRLILDVNQSSSEGRDHMQIEINPDGSYDRKFPPTLHSFVAVPDGARDTTYHL